jgi:hypothetical protein
MHSSGNEDRFIKSNVAALLGVVVLSAFALSVRAAEQPKPGPEHKKMEVAVGEWTYEGSAEPSPFGPAERYKGKETARMILGGFFLETRDEDKSESGYIFQGVYLQGYDPVTKTYVSHGSENDGTVNSGSTTISGNTWTSTGTRADSKGKVYKTKSITTFSSDGQTITSAVEYSADDGKTWLPLWNTSSKRVKK